MFSYLTALNRGGCLFAWVIGDSNHLKAAVRWTAACRRLDGGNTLIFFPSGRKCNESPAGRAVPGASSLRPLSVNSDFCSVTECSLVCADFSGQAVPAASSLRPLSVNLDFCSVTECSLVCANFSGPGSARSQFVTSALGELGFLLGNGVQLGLCKFHWAGRACSQFVTCAFCELGFLLGNDQRRKIAICFQAVPGANALRTAHWSGIAAR